MGMNSVESGKLNQIARDLHTTAKILETLNENVVRLYKLLEPVAKELTREVDLDKLVEDSKKIAEAGKSFEKIVDANQLEIPAIVMCHHASPIGCVTDNCREKSRWQEEHPNVLNGIYDPINGCLFPHEWRHNLGWDKLPEDLREQHQPHENHPMTEEAFRIYNAGLVAEFVVKTKHEEQK